MTLTNKANITIAPKQPFIDWAISLGFVSYSEEDMNEYESYLVDIGGAEDTEEILETYYEQLFEEQLILIGQPEIWPQNRSLELFNDWFSTYVSFDVHTLDNENEDEDDEEEESEIKDEHYYRQQIADKIRQIADEKENQETAKLFWQALEGIQPKSCIVKSGMTSGESIDFTLAFEKGGDENPFDLFINNIPEAALRYGVIFGLNPDTFHYNPAMSMSNQTHDFLIFKLRKHG